MLAVQVTGDVEVLRRLRKLGAVMGPDAQLQSNRKAAIALHSDVMRTFQAQGATHGRSKWDALKAGGRYTGLGRKRKDGSRGARRFQTAYKLLQDTGALRMSYVPLYDRSLTGVGALSVKGHADLAPLHENGNPARNLPARPMLPPVNKAMQIVTQVYGLAIEKAVVR
jgi:phage gpG-like protein